MGNVPELIFCYGDNRAFAEIALATGYRYGVRLPEDKPMAPISFADQNWHKPDVRAAYMAKLDEHRPQSATVLDLEKPAQLCEVLSWAEEAAQWCQQVLIIPKTHGIIGRLPRRIGGADVILAYSVPTKHGGSAVWAEEFHGWPVHLLGGSPQAQMRWSVRFGNVVSADGNMHAQQAQRCRFWSATKGSKGHWVQLSEVGDTARGKEAPIRAFRRSCENIMQAWRA